MLRFLGVEARKVVAKGSREGKMGSANQWVKAPGMMDKIDEGD